MRKEQYNPKSILRNRHVQTTWQTFFRRFLRVPVRRETWKAQDGEAIDLDLLPDKKNTPGLLVIHGLEGCSEVPYVRGFLQATKNVGWNAAALNLRSCGPTPLRHPKPYHSGFTHDLDLVMEKLSSRWGTTNIAIVGFSLGGNVALKWLAEKGNRAPSKAAVAISPPFDLKTCANHIDESNINVNFYRYRFMRKMRNRSMQLAQRFPDVIDKDKVKKAKTFSEFDEWITAKLHGFKSAEDYWEQSSCGPLLTAIRQPTLLISATDDPIVPSKCIPKAAIDANSALTLWQPPRGGHVGFLEGSFWNPTFVAETVALDFLKEHLSQSA